MSLLKKNSYHYELPQDLIAQNPMENRADSRLLHLNRKTGEIEHLQFSQIIDKFHKGDVLVLNNTKVIPARLFGTKPTGAKVEVFLLRKIEDKKYQCLVKPGRKLKVGSEILFAENLKGKVIDYASEGSRIIEFETTQDFDDLINKVGNMPLPPYIQRESIEKDKTTYQTVFAKNKGSVAAPTAGLHFTDEIFQQLKNKGVIICEVMLHVGLGTFRPVKTDSIIDHKMHSEFCEISNETAAIINKAKDENRRVISVGTTTTRTLESFAENNRVTAGAKWTEIFIYPGKEVQIIDGLITNFHMPESTLMMLVSAFASHTFIMNAYKIAVENKYRFLSYGDAMLIL